MCFTGLTFHRIQILLIAATRGGSGSKPRFLVAEENGAIPRNFFLVTKISLWSFQSPFAVEQSRVCRGSVSSLDCFGGGLAGQSAETVWEGLAIPGRSEPAPAFCFQ